MKKLLLLTVLASTSLSLFADPCTYLDRYQCRKESKFCQYQEAQEIQGNCVPKQHLAGQVPYITMCNNAVNTHQNAQVGCGFFKNVCDWVPGDYVEEGCTMKQAILKFVYSN